MYLTDVVALCGQVVTPVPPPMGRVTFDELTDLSERCEQACPEVGVELVFLDVTNGGDGGAKLLEVVLAAVAFTHVKVESGPGLRIERIAKILRDQLDQLDAVQVGVHVGSRR